MIIRDSTNYILILLFNINYVKIVQKELSQTPTHKVSNHEKETVLSPTQRLPYQEGKRYRLKN